MILQQNDFDSITELDGGLKKWPYEKITKTPAAADAVCGDT